MLLWFPISDDHRQRLNGHIKNGFRPDDENAILLLIYDPTTGWNGCYAIETAETIPMLCTQLTKIGDATLCVLHPRKGGQVIITEM